MTEKQYEDLMFGISMIITLLKKPPQPVPGMKYAEIVELANYQLENNAKETFQNLTGNPSNRETIKTNKTSQEVLREIEEEQRKEEEEERAKLREEEKAMLEKIENDKLASAEHLKNSHVTDTNNLTGETHESYF